MPNFICFDPDASAPASRSPSKTKAVGHEARIGARNNIIMKHLLPQRHELSSTMPNKDIRLEDWDTWHQKWLRGKQKAFVCMFSEQTQACTPV